MYKTVRKKAIQIRRRLFEWCGSDRYSKPALNNLDEKLERYIPYHGGFFIEAGANDGYRQSNTYYLEKMKGWTGILVEGIPELYEKCRKERKNSEVFNCALVSPKLHGDAVTMRYSDLMSIVQGARKDESGDKKHIRRGMNIQKRINKSYKVEVDARTLTSILDQVNPNHIDLLSLDVEGYEAQVLKGIDFSRYIPRFILVEANYPNEVKKEIGSKYKLVDRLSENDLLFEKSNHD